MPGGKDLLPEDVGVATVLGQLAQHVQENPAEGQRPTAVAGDQVIESETGDGRTGRLARRA
ncbi:hypothetical protein IDVR_25740 [Intrasporangium sp. DVR]